MSGQKGTPRFSALACLFLLPLAGSLAGAFALLLLLACVMVQARLSAGYAGAFAAAAVCFGCFLAAYLGARIRRSGGLLCGLVSFVCYTLLLACAALAAGCRTVETGMLVRTALLLPSGCAGGLLGLHRSERAARKRHTG